MVDESDSPVAGSPVAGSPVAGSAHALGEHLDSCLDMDGCAFGERSACPCVAWRLGFTLAEILEPHVGERGHPETPPEALRRILRERQVLRAADAVAKLGGGVMDAIRTASEHLMSRRSERDKADEGEGLRRAGDMIWSIAARRKEAAGVDGSVLQLKDAASAVCAVSYARSRAEASPSDGPRMRHAADVVAEVAVRWQDTPDSQQLRLCAAVISAAADRIDGGTPSA